MCFSFQILPAANIGQLEDHWQDIAQPVGGLAEPGRLQDPYHLNVAYRGMADYHPLMPGVSNFFPVYLVSDQRELVNRSLWTPHTYSPT